MSQNFNSAAPATPDMTIRSAVRNYAFMCCVLALAFFCVAPAEVMAQTAGAASDGGANMWIGLKSIIFGPWGLLIAAIIVAVGVFVWMRRGIGEGLMVMIAGFVIFLIPALVIAARNAGQSMSGGV